MIGPRFVGVNRGATSRGATIGRVACAGNAAIAAGDHGAGGGQARLEHTANMRCGMLVAGAGRVRLASCRQSLGAADVTQPSSAAAAENLATARHYLAALEAGATGDALAAFFDPGVIQEEFPNRLMPHGARRDLSGLLDAALRGQQVIAGQSFVIRNALAAGDQVAI